MQLFKQETAVRPTGRHLVLAMGLLGSMIIVSSGLAQSADSIGIAPKVPKNTVITTVTVEPSFAIVVSPDSKTVYVANYFSSSVSVLDATNNYTVKATTSVGSYPGYLAISPDGNTLYVSCYANPGTVSVIDTTQSSYPVTATLTAGVYSEGLAVTPDGKELYVTNQGYLSNGIQGTVSVFDTSTNALTTTVATGGAPYLVVFTDHGKQADLLNSAGTGYLQFINTVSGKISSSTGAGGAIFFPDGVVTDSSASTLYITNEANYVTVCDAKTGKGNKQFFVSPDIATEMELGQPAVTPNGKYMYVSYAYNYLTSSPGNQVVMLDVATGKVVGSPIPVGNDPYWIQMAPNGDTLYVANERDGTVTVIDTTP